MRRPLRRMHLLIWMIVAPAAAAGLILALRSAPADPVSDLADAIVTDGGR